MTHTREYINKILELREQRKSFTAIAKECNTTRSAVASIVGRYGVDGVHKGIGYCIGPTRKCQTKLTTRS